MEGRRGDSLDDVIVLALLLTGRAFRQRVIAELLNYLELAAGRTLVLVNWHTSTPVL